VSIAALAPVLVALVPGRVPQVVILILGGILIGPEVLGLAATDTIELFADLGLGFLFLLAGYELDPTLLRRQAGRLAMVSWAITLGLAISVTAVLAKLDLVHAYGPVALALTTTALGTLLPILRDNRMLEGRFGEAMFAAGAVGEMGPVLAIAVFLGANGSLVGMLSVFAVAGVAYLLTWVPRLFRSTRIGEIVAQGRHATSQTTLRLTIVLLVALLYLAAEFGLDIVLGAFFAGMVLRRWGPEDHESLEHKLDAVGYGFFIPVFFVSSGMNLDIDSIAESPGRMIAFFVLLLLIRGVPALGVYRRAFPMLRRVQLMFLSATALPLLVALTQIGLDSGHMIPENAAALVGAGVLSVAFFPLIAVRLQPKALVQEEAATPSQR
jgi:Kef-type K+ transport system membrane component KefB